MTDPGRSTVAHLRENVAGAALELPATALAELDSCPVEESVHT
jgi:pyridoxine 4-dehydrogenase